MGNIFAIGDIHGTIDKLKKLMDKIDIHQDDTLVFIGDYIDRGPKSYEVVDYLIHLKKQIQKVVFLKGNHEDMFEKYLHGIDPHIFLSNGGQHTLESYLMNRSSIPPLIPDAHREFYQSLVLFFETEQFIFVHAGMKENIPIREQNIEDLLWIRGNFIYSDYNFDKIIVFGHTPFIEPLVLPNKIGIDTGAVYGNKLTCVKLPDIKFYSV